MDENQPLPLQYETSSPSRGLCQREHIWNAVALAIFAILFLVPACGVVPRLENIFKDFKTELPGITKILLTCSRWAKNQYGWIYFLPAVPALWAMGLAVDRVAPTEKAVKRYGCWMRRVLLLLAVLWLALLAIGGFMPFLQLVQSVSGSAK